MSRLAPGLLVAAPPLGDPNFERSVILLAAHNDEGAFGWVINGAKLMSMAELLERTDVGLHPASGTLDVVESVVRNGGPVGAEQVWLLYRTEDKPDHIEDQFDLGCGITASSSKRMLEAVAAGISPDPIVGVAGHAGWGPSQLEDEILAGAWLPTDAEASFLFNLNSVDVWLRAYERIGTSAIAFTSKVVGSA